MSLGIDLPTVGTEDDSIVAHAPGYDVGGDEQDSQDSDTEDGANGPRFTWDSDRDVYGLPAGMSRDPGEVLIRDPGSLPVFRDPGEYQLPEGYFDVLPGGVPDNGGPIDVGQAGEMLPWYSQYQTELIIGGVAAVALIGLYLATRKD